MGAPRFDYHTLHAMRAYGRRPPGGLLRLTRREAEQVGWLFRAAVEEIERLRVLVGSVQETTE